VGAGVGPVPLGTEFCGAAVEPPGAPAPVVELLEPVLPAPLPPEPPLVCPSASEAWVSRTAVTYTSVFDCMMFLHSLDANAR
jgi:hypothetical protein